MAVTTTTAAGLPFREAISFFAGKVGVTTESWSDVWRDAHTRAFMVAGAASDALVGDFQAEIAKAVAGELPFAEFRKRFDAIVERHGWTHNGTPGWRARVIYETNLSTAYAAGRYAQETDPDVLAVFPYWQYVHSGAAHPRKQHLAWNGLTLAADDPFWTTHYPPNGWGCGCYVRPLSARNLARMGKDGPDRSPDIVMRPWRNPRTGAVSQVPEGVDPGWDYNPGAAWRGGSPEVPVDARWRAVGPVPPLPPLPAKAPRSAPSAPAEDRLTPFAAQDPQPAASRPAAPPQGGQAGDSLDALRRFRLGRPAAPGPATPAQLRRWMEAPEDNLVVGELAAEVQAALGARQGAVLLSPQTLAKQLRHHPDLTPEDYDVLRQLIGSPDVVRREEDRRLALIKRQGVVYVAAIKSTADGAENYLLSFRRARPKSVRQLLARYEPVLGDVRSVLDE
ncbi:phage minor head protein [Pseudoroseomonas cervicalis]